MNNRIPRTGIRLPYRKKTVSRQTSYVYHTATGNITLTPLQGGRVEVTNTCTEADFSTFVIEADGLTLDMLQELHRADNREVENNLREAHTPMTAREKERIAAWRSDPAYPERRRGNQFPDNCQRWHVSLDSLSEDEDGTDAPDRDPIMLRAWESAQPEEDDTRDRVREFVSTLSLRQQQIYQLHIMEERTLREAAGIMGITHQRASAILKQLKRNLLSRFHTQISSRKTPLPVALLPDPDDASLKGGDQDDSQA